jgi:hypothetical protein
MIPPRIDLRLDLLERGLPHPAWGEYIKAHALDVDAIGRFCGLLVLDTVQWFDRVRRDDGRGNYFEFADPGEMAAIVLVLDGEGEVIDAVAWATSDEQRFATLLGRAQALGLDQVSNAATYFAGQALQVHRSPLRWLKAGCRGCVVLDRRSAWQWLGDAPGPIEGEDVAHARTLLFLLKGRKTSHQIFVSIGDEVAA